MVIIETSWFTKRISELVSDEDYRDFQNELVQNPKMGKVIPGTAGLRKIRIAAKDFDALHLSKRRSVRFDFRPKEGFEKYY